MSCVCAIRTDITEQHRCDSPDISVMHPSDGSLPTAGHTSPPVDHRQQDHGAEWTLVAAVVWETGTSDVRAMPLKHKLMMRQQYTYISTQKEEEKSFVFCTLYFFHQDRLVEHSNTVFLTSGRLLERLSVTTGS